VHPDAKTTTARIAIIKTTPIFLSVLIPPQKFEANKHECLGRQNFQF
jgi:hypothetical protein